MGLLCAAAAAKTQGLLLGAAADFEGLDEGTGATFGGRDIRIRRLGVSLGRGPQACAQHMYAQRIAMLRDHVDHWMSRSLRAWCMVQGAYG